MGVEVEIITRRLRLRPVRSDDLDALAILGADDRVMAAFGGATTREQSREWLERLLLHWRLHDFGRFLVERDGTFVGVVGLSRTDYDAGIVPGTEIAWRLAFEHWSKGYATEAALGVLEDGFKRLVLSEIIGVTAQDNWRSRRVMDRVGMLYSQGDTFEHPLVPEGDPRRTHVVYRLSRRPPIEEGTPWAECPSPGTPPARIRKRRG
jgi:RimJ/RimL family protein N-acetyltransferase